ncbi:MAG: D-alanyl-D-alanine carboxypeptidase [Proteobacteria bacterium]|nr:D-alanyl-D-alanine carboxypeptidase [Pseudomonadota bacterium]
MRRLALFVGCYALGVSILSDPPEATAQSRHDKVPTREAAIPVGLPEVPAGNAGQRSRRAQQPGGRRFARPQRPRRISPLGRDPRRPILENELDRAIGKIWRRRDLRAGITAIYVVDAETGQELYAVHEDEPLNPASNVKLVSTATALHILGPDWRYTTRLLGPAPAPDGAVIGDVYLIGSHDPTLRADGLRSLAQAVKDSGVTRIDGDIYVGRQRWRESVAASRVTIRVQGTEPGQPPHVTVLPETEFVRVRLTATTAPRKTGSPRRPHIALELYRIDDELGGDYYEVEVSGAIVPGRHITLGRSLARGCQFSAHIVRQALVDVGVSVTGTVRRAALSEYVAATRSYLPVELARHESRPMRDIVAAINKHSINRLADRVIMTAGAMHYGGRPTMKKAIRAMRDWLRDVAGIDPGTVVLDTGSGLSYNTELAARHIVAILRRAGGYTGRGSPAPDDAGAAKTRALEQAFVRSLAVAGVDGTLRRRFRGSKARGSVIGKTGTLSRVVALSGIVAHGRDNALAFAIVSNGHRRRWRYRVRKNHEAIVEAMYRYLRTRLAQHDERESLTPAAADGGR